MSATAVGATKLPKLASPADAQARDAWYGAARVRAKGEPPGARPGDALRSRGGSAYGRRRRRSDEPDGRPGAAAGQPRGTQPRGRARALLARHAARSGAR